MKVTRTWGFYACLRLFWLIVVLFIISCNSSCNVEIAPNQAIAALNNENISLTCTAQDCSDSNMIQSLLAKELINGKPDDTSLLTCTHFKKKISTTTYSYQSDCFGFVNMSNNGTSIVCYSHLSNGENRTSGAIQLLVQGTIEDVTGLTVRKVDTANLLNISWNPVFAYAGLNVFYNICFNEMTGIQAGTWFNYSTTDLDPCQYLNMSITPFINKTGNILMGKTIHWDDIPTEAPNDNTPLNYTIIMAESGFVHIIFSIDSCKCSAAMTSNNLTLKNDTNSFSVTVPVTSNGTCLSTASVALSLYMDFEVDVYLHNVVGSTKQNETILIATDPLVYVAFNNGSVICNFTNDVIINHYATGCIVFYTDMEEPEYAPRNDESTVTVNINSTEYYNVCVVAMPSPFRCATSFTDTPIPSPTKGPASTCTPQTPCPPCDEVNYIEITYGSIGFGIGLALGITVAIIVCAAIISCRASHNHDGGSQIGVRYCPRPDNDATRSSGGPEVEITDSLTTNSVDTSASS